jgi:hypothetical protein
VKGRDLKRLRSDMQAALRMSDASLDSVLPSRVRHSGLNTARQWLVCA